MIRSIDKDILMQEIATEVVVGRDERYQFTWPNKREAILAANAPLSKTLRPAREESVNFDETENLYIEGDNLEVLKLLQETYLGKIKMIYIDPPYNTGSDFVYNDDFKQSMNDYIEDSGQYDEEGNRLEKNLESNGRFHTDWLNMIYPRLKLARNLLSDDGVIFISIDDNEQANLKKVCDEVFGSENYRNTLITRRRVKSLNVQFADEGLTSMNLGFEYVLIYSKSKEFRFNALYKKKEEINKKGKWNVFWSNADRPSMRYELLGFTPKTGQWRWSKEKALQAVENYIKYEESYSKEMTLDEYWENNKDLKFIRRIPNGTGKNGGVQYYVGPSNLTLRTSNWLDLEVSQISKEYDLPFENPKNISLIKEILKAGGTEDVVLDFFSGSSTTADAVMDLNAEDGGNRKYIMVQLPEETDEKSEAYKAGYKTICDIGKERIRRAGKKIMEENKDKENIENLDIGFRVLKTDSSNMKDVYYAPDMTEQGFLDSLENNIKEDRSPEDLLFQVMLDLGIPLSAGIQVETISGKDVFVVEDGFLIACFDGHVGEDVVKAIAEKQPYYAVFRDASMAGDSVATNFDQIFENISPETVRRVL
ncbi:site-specific DNA-methyltransferase [Aedoeadaptatus coxii]|uniref:site-specific DNA-methyltransferase n=1 Tax=Aedoeadaptatus coxii TaxID=755172 RepID=UPI002AD549BF|nr:site-specific DNA-methyltransferase [Peptoniphilus coxii]